MYQQIIFIMTVHVIRPIHLTKIIFIHFENFCTVARNIVGIAPSSIVQEEG